MGETSGSLNVNNQYDNYWAYIRHGEEKQMKIIQWYAAVVGAILAFYFKDKLPINLEIFPWPLATFLFVYSIFVCLTLLRHKMNYENWLKKINKLDNSPPEPKNFISSFFCTFTPVVIIGAGCTGLLETVLFPKSGYWWLYSTIIYVSIFIVLYHVWIVLGSSIPAQLRGCYRRLFHLGNKEID